MCHSFLCLFGALVSAPTNLESPTLRGNSFRLGSCIALGSHPSPAKIGLALETCAHFQKVCFSSALISAMCVCALGVRALLISVFCCFGPFCGRGRPQDLVERVGFEISCRNQGSLPSGIGSKAIFGVGDRPGGPSCVIRKNGLCVPQRSLRSRQIASVFV